MNLNELDSFNLKDAVYFHNELNPGIFHGDKLREDVREQLLLIAKDFIEHLGVHHLPIEDITLSGSNASYSYTPHSDIDLHILVDINSMHDDDVYRELFDAKKNVYNSTHDVVINGYEVELYVQNSTDPVISLGEYSVLNDGWIKLPRKRRAHIDQAATKLKYLKLYKLCEYAIKSNSLEKIHHVLHTIKKYRRAGLSTNGEFGPENLAFKILRHKGIIERLREKYNELHDKKLSLPKNNINEAVDTHTLDTNFKHQMKFGRYIYIATGTEGANTYSSKGYDSGEDIPGLSIEVFDPYNRSENPIAHANFIAHRDKGGEHWLESDMTRVEPDYRGQNIAYQIYAYAKMLGNDIKKSTDTDGELNQTKLGKKMWRGWGKDNLNLYPDGWGKLIKEIDAKHLMKETSGYIPSEKQKNDNRWKTALSVDINPYSIQDNAKRLGSKISRAGIPPLLKP